MRNWMIGFFSLFVLMLGACAVSPKDVRSFEPSSVLRLTKSPIEAAHCIAALIDEEMRYGILRLGTNNHIRVHENGGICREYRRVGYYRMARRYREGRRRLGCHIPCNGNRRLSSGGRQAFAYFRYAGRKWRLNADSKVERVMQAYERLKSGREPFIMTTTNNPSCHLWSSMSFSALIRVTQTPTRMEEEAHGRKNHSHLLPV